MFKYRSAPVVLFVKCYFFNYLCMYCWINLPFSLSHSFPEHVGLDQSPRCMGSIVHVCFVSLPFYSSPSYIFPYSNMLPLPLVPIFFFPFSLSCSFLLFLSLTLLQAERAWHDIQIHKASTIKVGRRGREDGR